MRFVHRRAYRELPVRGDRGALASVLRHLLGNAVAYGRPGEVRVEVEMSADGRVAIIGVRRWSHPQDATPRILREAPPLVPAQQPRLRIQPYPIARDTDEAGLRPSAPIRVQRR